MNKEKVSLLLLKTELKGVAIVSEERSVDRRIDIWGKSVNFFMNADFISLDLFLLKSNERKEYH